MLMIMMTVKPTYWPIVIFRGVTLLLVDASAKKVTKTKISSILVTANVPHAVPIARPNSMMLVWGHVIRR